MITVTRLNGQRFVVNAELIRTVESNPDTTIKLINGDHMIVKESMADVVKLAIHNEWMRVTRERRRQNREEEPAEETETAGDAG